MAMRIERGERTIVAIMDGESKHRVQEEEIPREDSASREKHERPSSAGEPGLFTAFATLRAAGRLILILP